MQFLKNFFSHENSVVGLCGVRKQEEYVKITIPKRYKKTVVVEPKLNYLLY